MEENWRETIRASNRIGFEFGEHPEYYLWRDVNVRNARVVIRDANLEWRHAAIVMREHRFKMLIQRSALKSSEVTNVLELFSSGGTLEWLPVLELTNR